MKITVPQSLSDYHHDRVIRSVVDALLAQKGNMPNAIEWEDLSGYYDALLSAKKAQVDKAQFLLQAWDIIWKPILKKHEVSESSSITDQIEFYKDMTPSLNQLWDVGFYRSYTLGDFTIYTHVSIEIDSGFYLGISIEGEDEEDSIKLNLSKKWDEMDDDGWYYTKDKLILIPKASEEIDVAKLIKLADKALSNFISNMEK